MRTSIISVLGFACLYLGPLPTFAAPLPPRACEVFEIGGRGPSTILDESAFGIDSTMEERRIRTECTVWALENGANPNHEAGSLNPLIVAVKDGNEAVVDALLNHGANPNVKDDSGISAVFWATSYQQDRILEKLLHVGADPNDHQPLIIAASLGDPRAVAALLATGKIPKNQIYKFEELGKVRSKTALDDSESNLQLIKYGQENHEDPEQLQSLYAYPRTMMPELKRQTRSMTQIQKDQTQVSEILKEAGWKCLTRCTASPVDIQGLE